MKNGERLSMFKTGQLVTLRIHSSDATSTYTLHLATGELKHQYTIPEAFGRSFSYSSVLT